MLSSRSAAPEAPSWGEFWPENPIRIAIDPNGNLIEKTEDGHVWDYVWNAENQLIRVCKDLVAPQTCDSDGVAVASFKYDPMGRRVERTAAGIATKYVYQDADILRESSAGSAQLTIRGESIDEPLAIEDSTGARSYLHADGLGSISRITDGSGVVSHAYRYDPWGNIEEGAGRAGQSFTAREWDPETGLFYYRARYYEAATGRFLSEDPKKWTVSPNFYPYVSNNPASAIDPYGLQGVSVSCFNCTCEQCAQAEGAAKHFCGKKNGGECRSTLKKYGLDRCADAWCRSNIAITCIGDFGGCGGPPNLFPVSPTRTIVLQSPAFTDGLRCGDLPGTLAHEFAHLCGVGADSRQSGQTKNLEKADNVERACEGP